VVERGVGDEVPDIFADGPLANEAPVEQSDLAAQLANQVLGPAVEVAEGAWQRLVDCPKTFSLSVDDRDGFAEPGGEGFAHDRMTPGFIIVEQIPVDRFL
jgi:hypothetical protein